MFIDWWVECWTVCFCKPSTLNALKRSADLEERTAKGSLKNEEECEDDEEAKRKRVPNEPSSSRSSEKNGPLIVRKREPTCIYGGEMNLGAVANESSTWVCEIASEVENTSGV